MTKKNGLDAHIVKKYASVSTLASAGSSKNDPDKIWGALGAMAMINVASQHIRKISN